LKKIILFSAFWAFAILLIAANDLKTNVGDGMAFATSSNFTFPTQEIKLDNVTLDVQIADTQARMEQGLQFSDPLPYNQGMLFVPSSPEVISMWMPNMKFALDIIWFDSNGIVLHIEKNIPPCTFADLSKCPVYNQDGQPSKYALEVTSGFIDRFNITASSKITIPIPEFGPIVGIIITISLSGVIIASKNSSFTHR
jgi:uncharacterized membrane protein (UPF0127 family)